MKTYRVRPPVATENASGRASLLHTVVFHDHGTHAIATVAGEELFRLKTLAELVEAMRLTVDDLEEVPTTK